jgi:hypothetical protein
MAHQNRTIEAKKALESIKPFLPEWRLAEESDITTSLIR